MTVLNDLHYRIARVQEQNRRLAQALEEICSILDSMDRDETDHDPLYWRTRIKPILEGEDGDD